MPNQEPTFEEALKKLEKIAERIESGEIGLENSIQEYEAGIKLINQCRKILDKAEQKVQKLISKDDQPPTSQPFQDEKQ